MLKIERKYETFNLILVCTPKFLHCIPHTSGNVHKNKNFWIFPQWVLNNLTLVLPYAWKRSDSTLHCLLEGYILSLLDALKEENLESKETIVHCFLTCLCLSMHHFVPLEHIVLLFPSFPLLCNLSIVMEDSSGGGPGGGLSFSSSRKCQQSLSLFYLYFINRNIHFSSNTCA